MMNTTNKILTFVKKHKVLMIILIVLYYILLYSFAYMIGKCIGRMIKGIVTDEPNSDDDVYQKV